MSVPYQTSAPRDRLESLVEGHHAFRRHAIRRDYMIGDSAVCPGPSLDLDRGAGGMRTGDLVCRNDESSAPIERDDVLVKDCRSWLPVGFLWEHRNRSDDRAEPFVFHHRAIEVEIRKQQHANNADRDNAANGILLGKPSKKCQPKGQPVSQNDRYGFSPTAALKPGRWAVTPPPPMAGRSHKPRLPATRQDRRAGVRSVACPWDGPACRSRPER